MLRRSLLIATPALALPACSGNIDQNVAQAANDAVTLGQALTAELTPLGATGLLSATALGTVGTAVSGIVAVAQGLLGVSTQASAQPLVQKIETYFNTFLGVVGALALPPPIGEVVAAAEAIVPVIEVAVGLVVPASAPRKGVTPQMNAKAMDPNTARVILKQAAATV